MRDDGIGERISELGRRELRRGPVRCLLGLVELLAENHRGERGKADTAPALVVLLASPPPRQAHAADGGEEQRGVVEDNVDPAWRNQLPSKRALWTTTRRPRRKSASTTKARAGTGRSKIRSATFSPSANCTVRTPSADRGEPGRFDVEGEKAIPREDLFELVKRGGEEAR